MKKLIFFSLLLFVFFQVYARQVDVNQAQASAHRFLVSSGSGHRFAGAVINDIKLLHTELNTSNVNLPVYHIFNTDAGFIIVSGDDRTREVLAYGDAPLNMDDIPENMKCWLGYYKEQIEYLQSHPDAIVINPMDSRSGRTFRTSNVEPLVTAMWGQGKPYNDLCPIINDARCLTGCAATSLSMLFHYWKYPTDSIPRIEGYTYYSGGYYCELPAIPSVAFDWDNMLDVYSDSAFTEDQSIAVALLMRHVGQAEMMKYGTDGSGASDDDILRAISFFGYDDRTELVVKATTDPFGYEEELISDKDWATMIQNELSLDRPIIYLAYTRQYEFLPISGHAFVVDGYNSTSNTYHVNWGWSGQGNGFFALNAFVGNTRTYNIGQSMIVGIEPSATSPVIKAPAQVDISGYFDQTSSDSFLVEGRLLSGDVNLSLNDPDGVFELDVTTIGAADAMAGKVINVYYTPRDIVSHTATVTLSSPGVPSVVITLNGTTLLDVYKPVMLPADTSYITSTQFRADWTDQTASKWLSGYTLEVSRIPSSMLYAEADFSEYPEVIGNLASEAQQYIPDGWTFDGGGLWLDGGCIELCVGGILTSCGYDLSPYGKVTVVVTAKNWSQYTNSFDAELTIATSQSSKAFILNKHYTDYTAVLDCNDLDSIRFTAGYYPMIQKIMIIGGEVDESQLRGIGEDPNYRLITGITDNHCIVKDLMSGGTFYYKVKAHYVNETESPWSFAQCVNLPSQGGACPTGDVNGDGNVNISDVTSLIDYILTGNTSINYQENADVNGDGVINVSDVTMLIRIVLSSN